MNDKSGVLGLAQCCHPEGQSYRDVLALAEAWCKKAQQAGVDLLVFPESLMTRYETASQRFIAAAQLLDGPFCQGMNVLARRYGLWLVYTANECNPLSEKPFNTAVVTDSTGVMQRVYRKTHLFDTDFTKESDRMSSGSALFEPIDTPIGKLGLGICYDLRFPELARALALKGCQVLVYPAAWVDGSHKVLQWRTLLAARAIENELFVAGLSRADEGYIGNSVVFAPNGEEMAHAGRAEELLVVSLDREQINQTRAAMPVFSHRRPELY